MQKILLPETYNQIIPRLDHETMEEILFAEDIKNDLPSYKGLEETLRKMSWDDELYTNIRSHYFHSRNLLNYWMVLVSNNSQIAWNSNGRPKARFNDATSITNNLLRDYIVKTGNYILKDFGDCEAHRFRFSLFVPRIATKSGVTNHLRMKKPLPFDFLTLHPDFNCGVRD